MPDDTAYSPRLDILREQERLELEGDIDIGGGGDLREVIVGILCIPFGMVFWLYLFLAADALFGLVGLNP